MRTLIYNFKWFRGISLKVVAMAIVCQSHHTWGQGNPPIINQRQHCYVHDKMLCKGIYLCSFTSRYDWYFWTTWLFSNNWSERIDPYNKHPWSAPSFLRGPLQWTTGNAHLLSWASRVWIACDSSQKVATVQLYGSKLQVVSSHKPGDGIAATPQINIQLLKVRLLRWMSMILYRWVAESHSRKGWKNYYSQPKQSRSVAGPGDVIAATLLLCILILVSLIIVI